MAIGAALAGIGGLASGVGSIFSGLFGKGDGGMADAISEAASWQYQAQQQALNYLSNAASKMQSYMIPYSSMGIKGAGEYLNMLGLGTPGYDATAALQRTPGYNWLMGQGEEALRRSAAGSGLYQSGAHLKGVSDWAQNLATAKAYEPYMNRLKGLVDLGYQANYASGAAELGVAPAMANLASGAATQYGQSMEDSALTNYLGQQQNWNKLMGGMGIVTGSLPVIASGMKNWLNPTSTWSGSSATGNIYNW